MDGVVCVVYGRRLGAPYAWAAQGRRPEPAPPERWPSLTTFSQAEARAIPARLRRIGWLGLGRVARAFRVHIALAARKTLASCSLRSRPPIGVDASLLHIRLV